jgi:hypothetical protein
VPPIFGCILPPLQEMLCHWPEPFSFYRLDRYWLIPPDGGTGSPPNTDKLARSKEQIPAPFREQGFDLKRRLSQLLAESNDSRVTDNRVEVFYQRMMISF